MDLIAKKYRVLKSLGQGAMGEVLLVLPPRGDPVALKLLKTVDPKTNHAAIEQFENEFKVLKKLFHPNIGQINDYGYDEELQKVFFTLPWLKGTDIFVATQDLDFEKCEELFVQTLRAINYLHQKTLIHCDLKPGNIFVENGQAIIIDFGLAGYWGESIVGTPTYLAPEIFRGARHTTSSDLYAAGVIFYNCLTRTQPFSGKTLQEVYDRQRSFTPPSISEINHKVPKYFSDIVATLLNKKPEERFPNAAAVIEEIDAFSKTKYSIETNETLLSYLPTQSELIGRKEEIRSTQLAISDFVSEKIDTPYHVILIQGPTSVGKSKLVSQIQNDLQLAKISVEKVLPPFNENDRDVLMSSRALMFEDIDSYTISADERKNLQEGIGLIEQKVLSPKTTRFFLVASAIKDQDFTEIKKLFPEEQTKITIIDILPFTREETKEFLVNILGQKEIPKTFVDKFYRDTEGLPGIATQLIQSMIEKGLLFDKSGRWNEDLLSELDKAFERLEVSESLEQQFEKSYATLSDEEADIVNWLSICPAGLNLSHLQKLIQLPNLVDILFALCDRRILREENDNYSLYRGVFQVFIQNNLPDNELSKRHNHLALPEVGLENKWRVYHLSYGSDPVLVIKAAEKLAEIYEKEGDRERSYETYIRLSTIYKAYPIEQKIDWYLKASSLLIWMNRFSEACDLVSKVEVEIQKSHAQIDFDLFLTLLEKKGLALLHLEKLDHAKLYFEKGLKLSQKKDIYKVHYLRCQNNLAEIEIMVGHHDQAIEIFQRTRELSKQIELSDLQNITNNDLGHVYLQLRDHEKALPLLKQDIRIFSGLKNREPLVRALYSYAEALRAKKDNDRAIQAYNECVRICKEGSFFPLLLRVYNGLGNLYLALRENIEALKNYQKAIEISVRLQEVTSKAALLVNQGIIYRNDKNWALATRRFLMAKQVLENKTQRLAYDDMLLSKCYNELAVIAVEEKNSMKALSYQLERMKLVDDSHTLRPEKFVIKLDLAELYLDNRLKDQFLNEFKELQAMAQSEEEKTKVTDLRAKWESIEDYKKQDHTAKIDLGPTS